MLYMIVLAREPILFSYGSCKEEKKALKLIFTIQLIKRTRQVNEISFAQQAFQ